MKTARQPAIIYGAGLLAALSLLWSAYAITDLMQSGPFGLSVAVAGDIGWVTVLWAEYRGVTIAGRTWAAPLTGWIIAVAVGVLLVLHGVEEDSTPQAIAGPFVVLVGKAVWTFALAAMKDPAALTPEQEAEIHSVIRDSEYTARLHQAGLDQLTRSADAEIARIKAEARTVLARDSADFRISLERMEKRAEIQRRTPLALTAGSAAESLRAFDEVAAQAIEVVQPGPEAQRDEPTEPKAQTVEPQAQPSEPHPSGAPIVLTSSQAAAPEPQAQAAEPEAHAFGFSAHLTAQSAQRAQSVARVAELVAQDPGLTSAQVAELLDVSPATAKRYLREARQVRP
jgi:hypothetical protein